MHCGISARSGTLTNESTETLKMSCEMIYKKHFFDPLVLSYLLLTHFGFAVFRVKADLSSLAIAAMHDNLCTLAVLTGLKLETHSDLVFFHLF